MRRPPPWAALLLASAGSWLSMPGCHQFHVCHDQQCEPAGAAGSSFAGKSGAAGTTPVGVGGRQDQAGDPTTNAGRSSDAARAGSTVGVGGNAGLGGGQAEAGNAGLGGAPDEADHAGQGGAPGCSAPLADCDESTLDGCEANLLTDLRNCGACRARCFGACIDGECHPFENLAENMVLPAWGGIARSSPEVYALTRSFSTTLMRWSAQGTQTLFTQGDYFEQIVAGVDRLYLIGGDGKLSSIPRSGGVVSSEGITARPAVVKGDTLYAVDSAGTPYWRSEISHETGTLPLPAPLPTDVRIWMANDADHVALVAENGNGTYTVHYLPTNNEDQEFPWVFLASDRGSPTQVRVGDDAVYLDVIVLGDEPPPEDAEAVHELREVDFAGVTRVVATSTGLLDFELVGPLLYLSVELPKYESVLRVVSLDDPRQVLDVQTSSSMASLTYSDGFFYFGDTARSRFARLPGWLE
jgi:hypothetical protein